MASPSAYGQPRKHFYPVAAQLRGTGSARDIIRGIAGDGLTMIHVTMPAGFEEVMHRHIHEQMMFIVSGRVRVEIEGQEPFVMLPGDFVHFPANVPHAAYAEVDSIGVDAFAAPARNEILSNGGSE